MRMETELRLDLFNKVRLLIAHQSNKVIFYYLLVQSHHAKTAGYGQKTIQACLPK